jgi:hypothetical protein
MDRRVESIADRGQPFFKSILHRIRLAGHEHPGVRAALVTRL